MVTGVKRTEKYLAKRRRVLEAATTLINTRGIKGTTLSDVAASIGLNTTAVTYYFKRKNELAAAVFKDTLTRLDAMVAQAGQETSTEAQVRALLEQSMHHHANVRTNSEPEIAILSDILSLDEPERSQIMAEYSDLFRRVRQFFGSCDSSDQKSLNTVRTHILVENIYWLKAWLNGFDISEFERLTGKVFDILSSGFMAQGFPQSDVSAGHGFAIDPGPEDMTENFLRVATDLINERGYLGASVERISAKLDVTKGSFYHHVESKDDLVVDSFNRSLDRVSKIQQAAWSLPGPMANRLAFAVTRMLEIQFYSNAPFLRTTALAVLPTNLRLEVLARTNRIARSFAGMISDGMADGSVRMVDAVVASQMLMASLNSASAMRSWAQRLDPQLGVRRYASTFMHGLLAD